MMVMEVVNVREKHRMKVNDVPTSNLKRRRMIDLLMFHVIE